MTFSEALREASAGRPARRPNDPGGFYVLRPAAFGLSADVADVKIGGDVARLPALAYVERGAITLDARPPSAEDMIAGDWLNA